MLQWPTLNRSPVVRIGLGFDAHRLAKGRRLVLGGVQLPEDKGLIGHSDADVLLHALTDAILGAVGLPDIGCRYPDSDPKYKDADSAAMLAAVWAEVRRRKYRLLNADCTLVCDRPRLAPVANTIRERIASILGVRPAQIGLKAKTTEGTRLALPKQSISAIVTVLLARS